MTEDKIGQSTEAGKPINPEQQIDFLLKSEDPVSDLKKICSNIPHRLSPQVLSSLQEEGRDVELIYYCLPTLESAIDHYGHFGLDEKELFETGFFAMQANISDWSPEKESWGENGSLKQSVSNGVKGDGGNYNRSLWFERCT